MPLAGLRSARLREGDEQEDEKDDDEPGEVEHDDADVLSWREELHVVLLALVMRVDGPSEDISKVGGDILRR